MGIIKRWNFLIWIQQFPGKNFNSLKISGSFLRHYFFRTYFSVFIVTVSNNKKNLTAEVAEHAEVEMAKSSGPGCRGKKGQNGQGAFQERSLRSLLPLRSSSGLHPRRIERQRGVPIHKRLCVFCLSQEKALRSLRTLRLIFSPSSEGAETFIIS